VSAQYGVRDAACPLSTRGGGARAPWRVHEARTDGASCGGFVRGGAPEVRRAWHERVLAAQLERDLRPKTVQVSYRGRASQSPAPSSA
jgi:hypothetical protein